jgi:hypothetical protein
VFVVKLLGREHVCHVWRDKSGHVHFGLFFTTLLYFASLFEAFDHLLLEVCFTVIWLRLRLLLINLREFIVLHLADQFKGIRKLFLHRIVLLLLLSALALVKL